MRQLTFLALCLPLFGCDSSLPLTPLQESCRQISLDRIKHPESFKAESTTEEHPSEQDVIISLNFTAWNGYKVPVPYKIACHFRITPGQLSPELVNIHWNGRPIRATELDEIRESTETP